MGIFFLAVSLVSLYIAFNAFEEALYTFSIFGMVVSVIVCIVSSATACGFGYMAYIHWPNLF